MAQGLVAILLGATLVRIIGSFVAGVVSLVQEANTFPSGRERVGEVLTSFGAAGDTTSAVLLLGAVVLVWVTWRGRSDQQPRRAARITRLLLAVTAVLVLLRVGGLAVIDSQFEARAVSTTTMVVALGLADLLLCLGGLTALRHAVQAQPDDADGEPEPLVFAVDHGTGEVFAFFSYAEAARTISAYSIEDDEFDFYADDGNVIAASVVDGRTRFDVTDDNRRDELVRRLRSFAQRQGLEVDDGSDPTAYAAPISDWQWLELWPGWLRGVGRMVRHLRV